MIIEISIGPFSPGYGKQVADLVISIQTFEFGLAITLEDQPDLKEIQACYQNRNGNFWIATIDLSVIGTIALLDVGEGRGVLKKMFVHKNYRGREFGVGQKLLDTLLEWANQKGFKEILLGTTEKMLAAHRFYEKNGFIEVEKEKLPATFPIMTVDTKFYKLSIDP